MEIGAYRGYLTGSDKVCLDKDGPQSGPLTASERARNLYPISPLTYDNQEKCDGPVRLAEAMD